MVTVMSKSINHSKRLHMCDEQIHSPVNCWFRVVRWWKVCIVTFVEKNEVVDVEKVFDNATKLVLNSVQNSRPNRTKPDLTLTGDWPAGQRRTVAHIAFKKVLNEIFPPNNNITLLVECGYFVPRVRSGLFWCMLVNYKGADYTYIIRRTYA